MKQLYRINTYILIHYMSFFTPYANFQISKFTPPNKRKKSFLNFYTEKTSND
jgi:hypothetical protein